MPHGKPAGVMCSNLDKNSMQCTIWNTSHYPNVCKQFAPDIDICGKNRDQALEIISTLELDTIPSSSSKTKNK